MPTGNKIFVHRELLSERGRTRWRERLVARYKENFSWLISATKGKLSIEEGFEFYRIILCEARKRHYSEVHSMIDVQRALQNAYFIEEDDIHQCIGEKIWKHQLHGSGNAIRTFLILDLRDWLFEQKLFQRLRTLERDEQEKETKDYDISWVLEANKEELFRRYFLYLRYSLNMTHSEISDVILLERSVLSRYNTRLLEEINASN